MSTNNCGSQYNLSDIPLPPIDDSLQPKPQTVTIQHADFISLIRKERKLDALIAAGVENWEGYEQALEYLE